MFSYLKIAGILAVVGLIAGASWKVNNWRHDSLLLPQVQRQLAEKSAKLATMEKSVEKWKSEAAAQQQRAETAEAKSQQVRIIYRDRLVPTQPTPAVPGEICAERRMLTWLTAEYDSLRRSW